MKTIIPLLLCASGLLLTGCHTYDMNGDVPMRYAANVQVVNYESIVRPPAKTIQIFDSPSQIKQPYHVIGLLLRPGKSNDEALILKALIWRARQLGADGVILLGGRSDGGQEGFMFGNGRGIIGSTSPTEPIFHAQAIMFDK